MLELKWLLLNKVFCLRLNNISTNFSSHTKLFLIIFLKFTVALEIIYALHDCNPIRSEYESVPRCLMMIVLQKDMVFHKCFREDASLCTQAFVFVPLWCRLLALRKISVFLDLSPSTWKWRLLWFPTVIWEVQRKLWLFKIAVNVGCLPFLVKLTVQVTCF